jgi:hypothetical protein
MLHEASNNPKRWILVVWGGMLLPDPYRFFRPLSKQTPRWCLIQILEHNHNRIPITLVLQREWVNADFACFTSCDGMEKICNVLTDEHMNLPNIKETWPKNSHLSSISTTKNVTFVVLVCLIS